MLRFQVFDDGEPAETWPIRNAHLIGSDQSAMRGEITFDNGYLICRKREMGAAALALQMPLGECGELTVQTCLLPERDQPYLLSLELARHRIMLLYNKLEEWGVFELPEDHPAARRFDRARKLFIEALCVRDEDAIKADRLASEALVNAIDGSEELALAHAEMLLNRRKQTGNLPRWPIGCGVALEHSHERVRAGLSSNFDFVCLPLPWRQLSPAESEYRWDRGDDWIEWASRTRMPVLAGPLISFAPTMAPDWVFLWEHDYDEMREVIYEHLERVVNRYRNVVTVWNVISGLHVNEHVQLSFDQLMDLTRMATMLVKKVQPSAKVLVELCQPFGEYYGHNQRSIPPLMYADLLVQSAISFDAFSIKFQIGHAVSGQYTRDLMQLSHLLDQFAGYGKALHVTVAAPSEQITPMMIASPDGLNPADANGGCWRRPWSQQVQSRWLEAALSVVLSKPSVESVAWQDMVDHPDAELPLSGLVSEDLQPKPAFKRAIAFRRALATRTPIETTAPIRNIGVKPGEIGGDAASMMPGIDAGIRAPKES